MNKVKNCICYDRDENGFCNTHSDIDDDSAQKRVMTTYRNKSYVQNLEDEQALHMAHSPYKVPRGLTELQVRRRINKYKKHGGRNFLEEILQANVIKILINDKMYLKTSYIGKVPATPRQLRNLLKKI